MKLKNNFAITGFMGAGKTTLFKQIKDQTKAFDLDDLISKEVGSIKRYIQEMGIEPFRDMEYQVLTLLDLKKPHIVFLGAGALETQQTDEYIRGNYKLIYLKVNLEKILERLSEQEKIKRPLFKHPHKLYTSRQARYELSDYTIDGNSSIHENVSALKEIIFE